MLKISQENLMHARIFAIFSRDTRESEHTDRIRVLKENRKEVPKPAARVMFVNYIPRETNSGR